jgi:hypothetical protein
VYLHYLWGPYELARLQIYSLWSVVLVGWQSAAEFNATDVVIVLIFTALAGPRACTTDSLACYQSPALLTPGAFFQDASRDSDLYRMLFEEPKQLNDAGSIHERSAIISLGSL